MEHVWIHQDDDLVDLTLHGDPSTQAHLVAGATKQQAVEGASVHATAAVADETVHTTGEHPWLTTDRSWVPAGGLRAGDRIIRLDGSTATITAVRVAQGVATMYNLTVSQVHTFAVGMGEFVVHNDCPIPDGGGGVKPGSIKGQIKAAQLPHRGSIRYVPPKLHPGQLLPRGTRGGYIDRFDNLWVRGPSRTAGDPFEWDVQLSRTGRAMVGWLSRDGKHLNVSLRGWVTLLSPVLSVN